MPCNVTFLYSEEYGESENQNSSIVAEFDDTERDLTIDRFETFSKNILPARVILSSNI